MTDRTPRRPLGEAPVPSVKAAAREARRSAALRENLKRRKEAARTRATAPLGSPEKTND